MVPPKPRLIPRSVAVVLARDNAVAVAAGRRGGPARIHGPAVRDGQRCASAGTRIVARDLVIAVDVAVVGRRDAGEVGDDVLDLRLGDHLLALQDAAQQQADDDQHDGDLDQREALGCVPRFDAFLPKLRAWIRKTYAQGNTSSKQRLSTQSASRFVELSTGLSRLRRSTSRRSPAGARALPASGAGSALRRRRGWRRFRAGPRA